MEFDKTSFEIGLADYLELHGVSAIYYNPVDKKYYAITKDKKYHEISHPGRKSLRNGSKAKKV